MAQVEVTMPKMGESITEGTVIVWHKQPGDAVEQDETLLEIGTDKVDTEVPSPAEGTLTEILVEEGDTVEVGTVIAMLETEAEAADASPADDTPDATEEPAEAAGDSDADEDDEPAEAATPDAEPSGGGAEIDVVMPKMGESITEGTVIVWFKEPGDPIDLDETLLEIGTDKVDTEVPSPAAGVLKERLVDEGETVEVGTKIAVITTEEGAEVDTAPADTSPDASPEPEPVSETPPPPSGDGAVTEPQTADRGPIKRRGSDGRFYSPLVRSIAEKEGLSMGELESIDGSGREGRVTKEDVLGYLETREAEPQETAPAMRSAPARPAQKQQPAGRPAYKVESGPSRDEIEQMYGPRVEVMEMDRMRQITAEHMVRSKATSAHVTSFAEADVTGLVRFREANKAAFQEQEGIKLTFTPFFVKAAVEALRDHPVLNASVEGDKIIMKKDYHIGIAVAIGSKGLLAPVIRNAGDKNLVGLAKAAADVATRARNKALQPDELQGGTFTVTNIGSLGSTMGTPIINQPQVAILATGAIQKRPVVIEDPELGDIIAVRHMMYLSLSYDHRIIDGAMGASYLQAYVNALEAYSGEMELTDV